MFKVDEQSQDSAQQAEQDYKFVIRLTCLAILITLSMEWRNFLPGFRHPFLTLVPLFEPLASVPALIDKAILASCIILLVWLFISPLKRLPAFGVSAIIIFWGIQDIVRFQPWFHMYCFVTLVAAFSKIPQFGLNALRIMVCGVYFWAGFHKLNLTFITSVMPWFMAPIYYPEFDWLFKFAAFITPFFEAAIGILLLFKRWRFVATLMAFTMLIMVFACLGPFGRNWGTVIPLWNIWLFLMELRLFLNPNLIENFPQFNFRLEKMSLVSMIMFVIAPTIAIFAPEYGRLGFKIFSGNTITAQIILAPEESLSHRRLFRGMVNKGNRLDFKFPIYHTEYAYRMRGRAIYPYLEYPSNAKLRIFSPPPFYSSHREYTDVALSP